MESFQLTILTFIYARNEKEKIGKFFDCVQLASLGKEYQLDSNSIRIDIQLKENNICYKEYLIFRTKSNKEISADYPIYAYKENIIYIDFIQNNNQEIENIKLVSLEIIYQSISEELLPKSIIYDNKELFLFDTFGNKQRKRIGLINIDPQKLLLVNEVLKKYPNFELSKDNSYELIIRIPANKDIQYSITDFETMNMYGLKAKEPPKKYSLENKESIYRSLLSFKNEFFSSLLNEKNINEIKNKIADLSKKYYDLKLIVIPYYENIFYYEKLQDKDIDIFIENFYFLELQRMEILINSEDEVEEELQSILIYINKFNKKYYGYISEISKLSINIMDKLLLIKCYHKILLDSIMTNNEVNFMNTMIVEKINEYNSYKKAINFVKDIIYNLTEDSRLFEIFLYLDSNAIENLFEKNEVTFEYFEDNYGRKKKIEYKKHPTEYGTNMSTVDEVKNHLLKLMPRYIVRINSDLKFNASYDDKTKIMIINEKKLFNADSEMLTDFFEDPKLNEKYVLPISIEILHELCGHGKKRLINEHEGSTEEYRDSKYDYRRCNVMKKVDNSKKIKYPESGIVLENYISNNKKVIKWLKKYQNKEGEIKQIKNVELWIGKDFNILESKIIEFINSSEEKDKESNSNYSICINKNDEDTSLSDEDDTCGFHEY